MMTRCSQYAPKSDAVSGARIISCHLLSRHIARPMLAIGHMPVWVTHLPAVSMKFACIVYI